MAKSTRSRRSRKSDKPPKPYADFPLSPHASGAWQKKIWGKVHYFGRWGQVVNGKMQRIQPDGCWKEALEIYKAKADDLYAGRTPRKKGDGLTLADLGNRFLTAKQRQLKAGEITSRTFDEYKATTDRLVREFGKNRLVDDLAADDFEALRDAMAEQWGPVRLGNEIQKVRTVFKYGYESALIDKPIRYGPQFRKPSASVLRKHKAKNGKRMLEADALRGLLDDAPVPLKAMLLLGLNCGFGNHDCATLLMSSLDLESGWVDYARPKNGIERRCPLWPETVAAIRDAIAQRPEPKQVDAADLVFITTRGRPWLSRGSANPVSVAARDLMKTVGVHRKGIGFYTLRHVFRTIADGSQDQVAANRIMGHADNSMAAIYRERIDDARLRKVADHVHEWLFSDDSDDGDTSGVECEPSAQTDNAEQSTGESSVDDKPTLRLFAG